MKVFPEIKGAFLNAQIGKWSHGIERYPFFVGHKDNKTTLSVYKHDIIVADEDNVTVRKSIHSRTTPIGFMYKDKQGDIITIGYVDRYLVQTYNGRTNGYQDHYFSGNKTVKIPL